MNTDKAVIFDMDGVLIDNNPYHKQAWLNYCRKNCITIEEKEFFKNIWGKSNEDILNFLYKNKLSPPEIIEHTEIKEAMYREVFRASIKPLDGLYEFLENLKIAGFKMGIATSAPTSNLNFVLEHLPIRHYFSALVDDSMISHGKPSPEVYLKAAEMLKVSPENCVAFEDSFSGISAAISAEMKVIGVTTTHKKEELKMTEFTIDDFTQIKAENVEQLLK